MRITSSFTTLALGFVARAAGEWAWALGTVGYFQANNCGDSSFNIEKSSESPLKADCEGLFKWFNDDRGGATQFFVRDNGEAQTAANDDSHYFEIGLWGTCGLAAMAIDGGADPVVISYGDTADIVRDAIDHHSTGDNVRVSGEMECTGTPDIIKVLDPGKQVRAQKVSWQIYKPGDNSLKVRPY
ncbi:hypothetical protein F4825DRAFT_440963 [Nemania diffusa]|nr:hypothetical protein F4825DRAFT_440963 [Nemania diffusa]